MRFLHVENARHIENYRVRLEFNDDTHGIVDLSDSLDGPIFEPLKNLDYFKRFRLEGHTLAWENGADFAPEYLKSKSECLRA
jgi:hypothetical protein